MRLFQRILTYRMVISRIAAGENVDFKILSEKIQFRHGKTAKNRIMKAPMSEKLYNWNNDDLSQLGLPNSKIINIYNKWGNGGFGIVFTGNMGVDARYTGEGGQGIVSLENITPETSKLFTEMASAMKADGALAIAQINHVGVLAITSYTNSNGEIFKLTDSVEDPMKFSKERIRTDVLGRFAHAAKVLHNSGFDGMEIHAAHEMLFNQFLAPTNSRDDEYGGSFDNRARLLIDTYKAIREVVPADTGFMVGVKLNSRDFQETGITTTEVTRLCELIETNGFDFVELTGGAMESAIKEAKMRDSTVKREEFFFKFIQNANAVFKETVVYITGRWQTSIAMTEAVKMGLTNGVSFGRWSCAEPDFPKKLLSGEVSSCPDAKFAPSEFLLAKHAAHHHMKQMSSSTDSQNVNLTNFTKQEEADNFKTVAIAYVKHVKTLEAGTESEANCIDYTPIAL